MGYIGRGNDAISNVEQLDNITFNGGTTYALTKSSTAYTPTGKNNILISIDGVVQQNNFTVSGTNIVFDWSPTSSNTCNWIQHYGVGVVNTPADDSVTTAKIADDQIDSEHYVDGSIDTAHLGNLQVTTAKIAADAIDGTKLADNAVNSEHYTDGSIDAIHLSANSVDSDAYVDGSIDNAHLADDAVGIAELSATGTASSSTFLRGDNSWTAVTGTTINTNADNRVITGSGTANTLNGEANLTFDGSTLACQGNAIFNESGADVDFRVESDGQENMLVVNGGLNRVGVGEDNPLGTFHVKTADSGTSSSSAIAESNDLILEGTAEVGMGILSSTSGSGSIYFSDSGASNGRLVYYHGDDSFRFVTNSSEGMRIASDGDVLIGTASEIHSGGEKLAVNGASSSLPILTLGVTHTSVFGGVKFRNGNGEIGSVTYNASGVAYNTSSDYRLKENKTPITDGITRLKTLKPYKFNFKTDPDETVDGFFAHEVSSIVPEAITGTKDAMHPEVLYTADDELPDGKNIGDVKEETKINAQGIDQSKLVPLLVASLQEAITKIETLETKVTALENA